MDGASGLNVVSDDPILSSHLGKNMLQQQVVWCQEWQRKSKAAFDQLPISFINSLFEFCHEKTIGTVLG